MKVIKKKPEREGRERDVVVERIAERKRVRERKTLRVDSHTL